MRSSDNENWSWWRCSTKSNPRLWRLGTLSLSASPVKVRADRGWTPRQSSRRVRSLGTLAMDRTDVEKRT
jgi:hypothetical protein